MFLVGQELEVFKFSLKCVCILGGVGKFQKIQKHLKIWKSQKHDKIKNEFCCEKRGNDSTSVDYHGTLKKCKVKKC